MFCECYLFFLWPPYAPAQVNGSSRNFYTWCTLSVNREVTTWIFSWSSLNYRVGQKVTKFGIFSDPARKLSALTPERSRISNSEKKLVKHRWLLYTCARFGELWPTNPWAPRVILHNLSKFADLSLYLWNGWTQVSETFTRDRRQTLAVLKLQGGSKMWLNFPYFRTPHTNCLLSRQNSVEYGNSKTTTLLPSAKCTRPLLGVHPVGMISSHANV